MPTRNRKRIGLALGGGVARGPAHVGVLAVLEREGVPIDCVAGTSAGAIVGAAYCAGLSVAEIRELAIASRWWQLARPVWPRRGLVSFEPMARWLEGLLGPLDIGDLAIPFAAVATDLAVGASVILCQGRLSTAVQASCAVPGLVTPVQVDGRQLVDGGVADNLPVDAARLLGADFVIGVDLFEPSLTRRWGPLSPGLAAIETLIRQAGGGVREADCLITPNLSGVSYLSFSESEAFMALGVQAAEEVLPALRQMLTV